MVLSWFAKKWFYYKGVRFYESKDMPSNAESVRIQFNGAYSDDKDFKITFEFFREIYFDTLYKKGAFTSQERHSFLVRAHFDGFVDEKLLKFNDTRLLCKSSFFPVLRDEVIAEVLQGLYIAYIKNHLLTK